MLRSEFSRLQAWLHATNVPSLALNTVTATPVEQVRVLNALECRFDGVLADEMIPPLEWGRIRRELELVPSREHPWYDVGDEAAGAFARHGYGPAQTARARRLWHDFILVESHVLNDMQAAEGWVAGLEYLLCRLYFLPRVNQREIADRHYVSTSTVSMRYRALVETLGVVVFDHPARKRLDALRTLAVDTGPLSEGEFRSRLLAGDLSTVIATDSIGLREA